MQIVIEIPENYNLSNIKNGSVASQVILNAVKDGKPLPKKHGDLIDRDKLREDMVNEYTYRCATSFISFEDLLQCIWLAPAVIREDNEE